MGMGQECSFHWTRWINPYPCCRAVQTFSSLLKNRHTLFCRIFSLNVVLHWLFKIILLIVSMTYLVVLIRFAFPCKSAAHFNDEQFLNC